MQPKSVGIREAKIQLSKLLKLVKGGNEVILTDRGQPVGKIVPIESQSLPLEARIRRLENQGVVEPGSKKRLQNQLPELYLLTFDTRLKDAAEGEELFGEEMKAGP